jgi:hypothetical protein
MTLFAAFSYLIVVGLVGPHVARPLRRIVWPDHAALVGGWTSAGDPVDGRATGKQGDGLSRPPVVLQAVGIELGVSVLQAACPREAATAVIRQVIALIDLGGVWSVAVATRVVGHDAPADF